MIPPDLNGRMLSSAMDAINEVVLGGWLGSGLDASDMGDTDASSAIFAVFFSGFGVTLVGVLFVSVWAGKTSESCADGFLYMGATGNLKKKNICVKWAMQFCMIKHSYWLFLFCWPSNSVEDSF